MFRPPFPYRFVIALGAISLSVMTLSACGQTGTGTDTSTLIRSVSEGHDQKSPHNTLDTQALTEPVAPSTQQLARSVSEGTKKIPRGEGTSKNDWPVFRGTASATGVAGTTLPDVPELLWKFSVEKETGKKAGFESTAVIVDGVVYVGDDMVHFFAINLATGKLIWKVATEAGFTASAAVRDGKVFIGDSDGVFYCFDAKSGKELWKHTTEMQINSSANFFEQSVIVGSQDGTLYRFALDDGRVIWKYLVPVEGGIQCSPTISKGRTFVAGCDAKLHVVNLTSGKSETVIEIGGPALGTPALSGAIAYCGTNSGELLSIDWKKSEILWRYEHPRRRTEYRSSPALTDKTIILGGRNKLVEAIDRKTGKPVWTFTTRGRVDSSPVVVGERVFVGSGDGRLYAINLTSGEEAWNYDAGDGFYASAGVADGRLVIGNAGGMLYCFGSKKENVANRR